MSGYHLVTGGHLGDAVLMQLLDQEPAPPEAREHVGACSSCAARLDKLRDAGALLRGALPDVAMPRLDLHRAKAQPRAWLFPLPIAAAATLVLLASAAAATPPVRAWIMRHIEPPEAPAPVNNTPARSGAQTSIAGIVASFAPSDTALVLRFDQRQARGALLLKVAGSDRISAQAVGGTSAEELVVLPGQLRVVNSDTSVADYRVTVPTSVRTVRVVIGTSQVAVVRITSGLERRIDLR